MDFQPSCAFCNIVAKKSSSKIHFEDDDIFVFENALMGKWAPMMLLLIPKEHMAQKELWRSNKLWNKVSETATRLGEKYCPKGFRLVSNFGNEGMQTQSHAHLHMIGRKHLGPYVDRNSKKNWDDWIVPKERALE